MQWVGKVINGRFAHGRYVADAIRKYEGQSIRLSIDKYQPTRTNAQNRYYWGVVIPAMDTWLRDGGTVVGKEDIHNYLMTRVGKFTDVKTMPNGETMEVRNSSTSLTVKQWMDYIELINVFAVTHGIYIPEPEMNWEGLDVKA